MKTRNIIFIVSIIILITILIIVSFILNMHKTDIESAIIQKEDTMEYIPLFIGNYDEYNDILLKYHILGKLSNNDFYAQDYIVDFIPYQKNLKIINIDIQVSNKIKIIYKTNPQITNSNKLIINFIPIQKNIINNEKIIEHEFK